MKYTLRQLEIFLATVHGQNVSRAAESLSMSQSAASSSLKDLESQFNTRLFDRIGKRLQINEFGQRIRPQAEALLAQAKEFEQVLSTHQQVGHLRIGATLTIGNYIAVGLITRFLEDEPGAKVKLEVANTSTIIEEILNFDIDLGLIEGELQHPDLDIIPWRKDQLVCFCAAQNPLGSIESVSDLELSQQKWILREYGSGTRQTFDRAMSGLLPQLNVALELQHTEAIKRAVEGDLGISCLSTITLKDAFERGTLAPINILKRDFSREFYLVIHKHKYRSRGIQRWMQICDL